MLLFFFAVWAGGHVLFLAVRAGGVFFAVRAGTGVHSLTGLPGWALRDLTTKRPNSKKKTGSSIWGFYGDNGNYYLGFRVQELMSYHNGCVYIYIESK